MEVSSQLHALAVLIRGSNAQMPLNTMLRQPQNQSLCFLVYSRTQNRIPASLVTVPTELSQVLTRWAIPVIRDTLLQTHTKGRLNIKEKDDNKISLMSRTTKSLFLKTEVAAVGKRTDTNVCYVHRTVSGWYTDDLTSVIHILSSIMNWLSGLSHLLQLKGLDSCFVRKGQCTDAHKATADISYSTSLHSYRCVSITAALRIAVDTGYPGGCRIAVRPSCRARCGDKRKAICNSTQYDENLWLI